MIPKEDIELFARGFARRHGPFAKVRAVEQAQRLQQIGDRDGHAAWMAVADTIDTPSQTTA